MHGAYKSGYIVKRYKELGGRYADDGEAKHLKRWFDEKWRDVGNKEDALHLMNDWDSPQTRYIKVFEFLKEKGLLYLKMLQMTPEIGQFATRITPTQSTSPHIPNGRKRKVLEMLWNFTGKAKNNISSEDHASLQQISNLYMKKDSCFNVSFFNEKKVLLLHTI